MNHPAGLPAEERRKLAHVAARLVGEAKADGMVSAGIRAA